MNRAFYLVFLVLALGSVFYSPPCYVDRYFTSGTIWVGITVGFMGLCSLFSLKNDIKCSVFTIAVASICFCVGIYAAVQGKISLLTALSVSSLVLLMGLVNHSGEDLKLHDFYLIVSLLLLVELVVALGQFLGLWGNAVPHQGVGSFDNPAGLVSFVTMALPCTFPLMQHQYRGWKILGWSIAVVAVLITVFSGSRTGMLAAAGILLLFLCGQIRRIDKVRGLLIGMGIVLLFGGLYLWKKDSADGRLLIWRCSTEMIKDAPFLGHGPESFQAKYMTYQAAFFRTHPDLERWEYLADTVKHPFNEFLKIGVEYGLLGLWVVTCFIIGLIRLSRSGEKTKRPLFWGLAALGICCMFSYPMNYPVIRVLLCIYLGLIVRDTKIVILRGWVPRGLVLMLSMAMLVYFPLRAHQEREWAQLTQQYAQEKAENILEKYEKLYPSLRENPFFLYNYGVSLYYAQRMQRSQVILEECADYLNDMDVQMVLGRISEATGDYERAEEHFVQASYMCPNRFFPLYRLMDLYEKQGEWDRTVSVAWKILNQPIKVQSATVQAIRRKAQAVVEQWE